MKVSVLLLTIDRFRLTRCYVGQALARANYPFDLCITDNGTKSDHEIFTWCEQQNPKLYIKNDHNAGTAQALNKMVEMNPSDYYVFIGNDIQLPQNWLKTMVEYAQAIPQTGIIGIDWRGGKNTFPQVINGKTVTGSSDAIFGTQFITKTLRDKIGKYCEDYGTYGLWDSDYWVRSKLAGFENYYLPNMSSHHFGDDTGKETPYRQMKNASISKARPIYDENFKRYHEGNWYI
jgi:GT2 family glycosyltransferase